MKERVERRKNLKKMLIKQQLSLEDKPGKVAREYLRRDDDKYTSNFINLVTTDYNPKSGENQNVRFERFMRSRDQEDAIVKE